MAYVESARIWDSKDLLEGYSAMAKDAAREREAVEWSEGLIGDSSAVDPGATSSAPSPQPR